MGQVLVVEDNPDNSTLAEKILNHLGHHPIVCDTGQSAREWAGENLPDLVLMDVTLPDINGFDLIQELRTDPRFSRVPFVVLTAHSLQSYQDRARDEGIDGFLVKPFMPRQLIDIVSKFLPRGESA